MSVSPVKGSSAPSANGQPPSDHVVIPVAPRRSRTLDALIQRAEDGAASSSPVLGRVRESLVKGNGGHPPQSIIFSVLRRTLPDAHVSDEGTSREKSTTLDAKVPQIANELGRIKPPPLSSRSITALTTKDVAAPVTMQSASASIKDANTSRSFRIPSLDALKTIAIPLETYEEVLEVYVSAFEECLDNSLWITARKILEVLKGFKYDGSQAEVFWTRFSKKVAEMPEVPAKGPLHDLLLAYRKDGFLVDTNALPSGRRAFF